MAESIALFLKANGTDIKGDSTQTSLGRENSIEVLHYEQNCNTAREASSGIATGRRTYEPLFIKKRIDKSSPLIAKAMVQNQVIDGKFMFFRPNPLGDGTTQQFYTVEIKGGRISHHKQLVPDVTLTENQAEHPLEEVSFTFHTIKWRFEDGGIEHEDTWGKPT
jgi:type VI secretion system secreted protein Hcp